MVFVVMIAILAGCGLIFVQIRSHEIRVMHELMHDAGCVNTEYDWLAQTMTGKRNGVPVSWSRPRRRHRLRLEQPSPVTLHVTRKDDLLARLNDAFRADVIEVERSAFRFYGDAPSLARTLNDDDQAALAMHEVLRGGAELIVGEKGITVEMPRYSGESPAAAWRLIVAVDRCLNPGRQAR